MKQEMMTWQWHQLYYTVVQKNQTPVEFSNNLNKY